MIRTIKELLRAILAPIAPLLAYLGFAWVVWVSIFRRAELGMYVLAALIPLTNLRYVFHAYPLGKDLVDIMMVAITIGILLNKNGFDRSRNSWILVAFVVLNYVAVWHTSLRFSLPLPITGGNELLREWKNYTEMVLLYHLAFNSVKDEKQQKTLICIMATMILLISVREFRDFSQSGGGFSYDKRVLGPFWIEGLGPNHAGAFFAHYMSALLGLYLFDSNHRRKWLCLGAIGFSLHPLFFAYSRGAYLSFLAVVTLFGILKRRSLLLVPVVLLFAWQLVLPDTVVERITMTESSSGELESSAAERLILWEKAVRLFQDNPLFGVGFGGTRLTLQLQGSKLTDTHNFYLKMLSDQGFIGLGFFVLILFCALRSGWYIYCRGSTPFTCGLGFGLVGCVIAMAITNAFGDRWSYFSIGSYFFLWWGMVDRAIYRLSQPAVVSRDSVASSRTGPIRSNS